MNQSESIGNNKTVRRYTADLVFLEGKFQQDVWVEINAGGMISAIHEGKKQKTGAVHWFRGKALLPGLVNTHSHAFQHTIRGRTESVPIGRTREDFWTWRDRMYHAALRLSPEGIYLTAKMVFIEMLRTGITTVGEFHYVHNRPDGKPYSDRNEIAKQVLRAAREVGIRICLLRVAYGRSGYKTPPNPLQRRFIEPNVNTFLCSVEALSKHAKRYGGGLISIGVATHSIRAVEASWMTQIAEFARMASIPYHMHACEQRGEILQSKTEYGMEPIEFLADLEILGPGFTGVHCTHLNGRSKRLLAKSGACISACPTTERNLGDGVLDATSLLGRGVPIGLGTDSQCQVNLFEDMRLLEYNLRLVRERRNLIYAEDDQIGGEIPVAPELFRTATKHGGVSLNLPVGGLKAGLAGDFFTIGLRDLSLAGWDNDSLLSKIVFALDGRAVRDVVVGGKVVVENGRHSQENLTLRAYNVMSRRLWEDL